MNSKHFHVKINDHAKTGLFTHKLLNIWLMENIYLGVRF